MTSLNAIEQFLSNRRFAVVGVSRDPKDFSRTLFRELIERQYDVVPVNPLVSLVEERHCFASVKDINPPVTAALIMTSPLGSEDVVRDCVAAGVKSVWFYRAAGKGSLSENAVSYCKEHHLEVVDGHCPMMFLRPTGFPHRIHRFISKMVGSYPK